MARRQSRKQSTTRRERGGKSERERQVELLTWGALVLVFAVLELLPDTTGIPNFVVPLTGAIILLGSGIYQYAQQWRVSPVTWLGGAAMIGLAFYNLQVDPTRSFTGASLLVFFAVIIFGVITGET